MDQSVCKHKTYQHPAGCYCCQFQDNKWFSTEQNSKLLFHKAIKAVDIAYWHTARINITYCTSFHSDLSSGQGTIRHYQALFCIKRVFMNDWKTFKLHFQTHYSLIFNDLKSPSTAVCNGLVLFSWRQGVYFRMEPSRKTQTASLAFLAPQDMCSQHVKKQGKGSEFITSTMRPLAETKSVAVFWAHFYDLVVVCFINTSNYLRKEDVLIVCNRWTIDRSGWGAVSVSMETIATNRPVRYQRNVLEKGEFVYFLPWNKPTMS